MSISFKALGAGQEVGRSCVIVRIKDVKIMFDCGVHMAYNDHRKFPDFRKILEIGGKGECTKKYEDNTKYTKDKSKNYHQQSSSKEKDSYNKKSNTQKNQLIDNKPKMDDDYNIMYANLKSNNESIDYTKNLDLVIITHFHLDHVGALPYFTEICGYNGPILTSQPTKAILPLTLEDFRKIISDYRGEKSPLTPKQITDCVNKIQTIEIGETKIIKNRIKVTPYYAGHVLGAGMYHIEVDGHTVVYTGDYNTLTDRHLSGAYIPKIYPDVLITETTYGDTVRDTKRVREREFLKKIQLVIERGGKVLIPIFALGRAQELCILLDTHWRRTGCTVPIYFAGPMAEKANFYYKTFTNWTNNAVKNIFLEHNVFDFSFVQHGDKSVIKSNTPMVIFATPGMLHGGLSLQIFKEIAPDHKNCVIIPGYCTQGTVGNKILSGERIVEIEKQNVEVNCEVYYMSFSAHADAKGILSLIKNASPKNLVLVHGDVEVMKRFQKTVESMLDIRTYMPPNLQEIPFERVLFYYQISVEKKLYEYLNYLMKLSKKKLLGENIKELKANAGLQNKSSNNIIDNDAKSCVSSVVAGNEIIVQKNEKILLSTISFDKFDKIEHKTNLNIHLNLGYDFKKKNLVFSVNSPLMRLDLKISCFSNKINLKIKNKNEFENSDIRTLFELYMQAKDNKMFVLYNHHLKNSNLQITRNQVIVTVKWTQMSKNKKEKTIYDLIKFLDSFININL